jgi:hypothetical protein
MMNGMNGNGMRQVQLVFADEGAFHSVIVSIRGTQIAEYERLVDLLREEPSVTKGLYIDMKRLVSASLVDEEGP